MADDDVTEGINLCEEVDSNKEGWSIEGNQEYSRVNRRILIQMKVIRGHTEVTLRSHWGHIEVT